MKKLETKTNSTQLEVWSARPQQSHEIAWWLHSASYFQLTHTLLDDNARYRAAVK